MNQINKEETALSKIYGDVFKGITIPIMTAIILCTMGINLNGEKIHQAPQMPSITKAKPTLVVSAEEVPDYSKNKKTYPYPVKKGDVLGKIASKFGTSVKELKKINNLKSDNIFPGNILNIPIRPLTTKKF